MSSAQGSGVSVLSVASEYESSALRRGVSVSSDLRSGAGDV